MCSLPPSHCVILPVCICKWGMTSVSLPYFEDHCVGIMGLGYSSGVEDLANMHESLGEIPGLNKKKEACIIKCLPGNGHLTSDNNYQNT